jgi:hypothetical protein
MSCRYWVSANSCRNNRHWVLTASNERVVACFFLRHRTQIVGAQDPAEGIDVAGQLILDPKPLGIEAGLTAQPNE